ncbi:DNA-protecting protein DprA, partial [Salmonella enterica]
MRPEEIALRMRGVTGLQTVVASRLVRQLSQMSGEPRRVLHELGLNERQQAQFNRVDPVYLAATLR